MNKMNIREAVLEVKKKDNYPVWIRLPFLFFFACMVALLLTGNVFVMLVLLPVLVFLFVFKSSKDQKSLIVVCLVLMVVLTVKVFPQNGRYIGQIFSAVSGGKKTVLPIGVVAQLRITKRPVHTLSTAEKRDKIAMFYLDSIHRVNQVIKIKREIPKNHLHPLTSSSLTYALTGE